MAVLAHLEVIATGTDRRSAPRFRLSLGTVIEPCQSSVVIQDISATGVLFETAADLADGDSIEVHLPALTKPLVASVVWSKEALFGCQFGHRIPNAAVSAALLRSVPLTHLNNQSESRWHNMAHAQGDGLRVDKPNIARRFKTAAAIALVCAGLTYLVMTASTVSLIVSIGALSLLCMLLVACCIWTLDNVPFA